MLLNTSILLPQLFCNVEFEFSWFHNTKIHQKFWFWKYIINDFGFSLDSSDVDLWNIDLLDTDIPSKHFVCLQDVLKTSSAKKNSPSKTSSRRLQDVFARSLQDALEDKIFVRWRRVEDQQMFAGLFPLSGLCTNEFFCFLDRFLWSNTVRTISNLETTQTLYDGDED